MSVAPAGEFAGFEEGELSGSILPGDVSADLDWDDEEEATQVFDRGAHDLFGDLVGRSSAAAVDPDETAKRNIGQAAALLKQSGGRAAPVSVPPAAVVQPTPAQAPAPQPVEIPAPAPVPEDLKPSTPPVAAVPSAPPHEAASMPPPAAAPGRSRTGLYVLVLAAVVAVVAGLYFYIQSTATADVKIVVTNQGQPVPPTQKVEIFINGELACAFSPCQPKAGVEPGPLDIRVVSGELIVTHSATVEGGKNPVISVALDKGKTIESPAPKVATLELVKTQKELTIKVFVNDADKGVLPMKGESPLTIKELPPGEVKLRFEGGDKHRKLSLTEKLAAGDTRKLDITLALLEVEMTFRLATRGAQVKLLSDDAGKKSETQLRFDLRGEAKKKLDTALSWKVVAEKKDHEPFEKPLSFNDGKAEQILTITLVEKKDEPTPVASSTATTTGPTATTTQAPEVGGMATINVNSAPPSLAIVNGRPVGTTPKTGLKVPAGSVLVKFKHKKYGVKVASGTVKAGQTRTFFVRFKKKPPSD